MFFFNVGVFGGSPISGIKIYRTQQGKKKTCPENCLGHVKVKVAANAVNRSILSTASVLAAELIAIYKRRLVNQCCDSRTHQVYFPIKKDLRRTSRRRPLPWLFHGITLLSASSSSLSIRPSQPSIKVRKASRPTCFSHCTLDSVLECSVGAIRYIYMWLSN